MATKQATLGQWLPWRGLVLPLLLVAIWELVVRARIANPVFLPPVSDVVRQGARLVSSGEVWVGLRASLARDLAGLAIGGALGIAAGVALGVSRRADRLFLPTVDALKQISPFALIPLMSFWFGLREPAKIAFIAITCVFPMLVNTYEGVRNVEQKYLEVARIYRYGPARTLALVILPAAAPSILRGLHVGVFFSWLGTVGSEYFFTAGPGAGNIIIDGRNASRMDLVLFGVVVIGLTGYLLNVAVGLVERRVLHWRTQER